MAKQPFKFRHVNKFSGAFVFAMLLILVILIVLTGRARQWFIPAKEFYVYFPNTGGTQGIERGSDVMVMGNHVGHVHDILLVRKADTEAEFDRGLSEEDKKKVEAEKRKEAEKSVNQLVTEISEQKKELEKKEDEIKEAREKKETDEEIENLINEKKGIVNLIDRKKDAKLNREISELEHSPPGNEIESEEDEKQRLDKLQAKREEKAIREAWKIKTFDDLEELDDFEQHNPEDIGVVAVLRLKGDFINFIGTDSEALLKKGLGGLGSAYFDIGRGMTRPGPENREKFFIAFNKEEDVTKKAEGVLMEVKDTAQEAMRSITETSKSAKEFVDLLKSESGDLMGSVAATKRSLIEVNHLMRSINDGEGPIGRLTSNKETEEKLDAIITSLETTSTQMPKTLANLDGAIENLDSGIDTLMIGVGSFNTATGMLVDTVETTDNTIAGFGDASEQLDETLREGEILVEGLQDFWLIRRFVKDDEEDKDGNKLVTTQAESANPQGGRKSATKAKPKSERGGIFNRRRK